MKSRASLLTSALTAVLAVFLVGCRSLSTSSHQEVGGPRLKPTDPDRVEVTNARPNRPYVRVGEIRLQASNPAAVDASKIEATLRKEAAKMGADAALVYYDKTAPPSAQDVVTLKARGPQAAAVRVVLALAVKFQ